MDLQRSNYHPTYRGNDDLRRSESPLGRVLWVRGIEGVKSAQPHVFPWRATYRDCVSIVYHGSGHMLCRDIALGTQSPTLVTGKT
jgi:hypothetical protein